MTMNRMLSEIIIEHNVTVGIHDIIGSINQ